MKKSIKFLGLAVATLCSAGQALADDNGVVIPDSTGFKFTDVVVVKTTPVRDQNQSGTCWCFSGDTFLESEIIGSQNREIDLSEMYTVRMCYEEKALRFIRMYGQVNFSEGGGLLDVPYIIRKYGAMPEEAYPGMNYGEDSHDHSEMVAALTAYLKSVYRGKKLSTAWFEGFKGILDAYFGKVPETFTYNGKTYTPQSYAESLNLYLDNYAALTSFTHHPFYQPFVLEVPDNWLFGLYMNVQLDELKAVIDNSLNNGHAVLWAADVSEDGFNFRRGFALMPKEKTEAEMTEEERNEWAQISDGKRKEIAKDIKGPVEEIEVTQESRQEMFDRQLTTDDHGMVIVGLATDQNGKRYYKVQNSWNTNQLYGGFFYVSESYLLAKTMSIMVNKSTIPADIKSKINMHI